MKLRLQTLLTTEKIASSKFADIVGVNRSSISHLISGRNNPSLDFLQKVLVKFPHINPDWLLLGQGTMYRNSANGKERIVANPVLFKENVPVEEPPKPENKLIKPESKVLVKEPEETVTNNTYKEHKKERNSPIPSSTKQLDRIIFFYKDGSFDTYQPSDNS